jgi:hypothetical protein
MKKPTNKYKFTMEYNGEFNKSKFYFNDIEIPVKSIALIGNGNDGVNFALGIVNELESNIMQERDYDVDDEGVAYVSSSVLPLDLDANELAELIEQGCDGVLPIFKRREYAEQFGDGEYNEINITWEDENDTT